MAQRVGGTEEEMLYWKRILSDEIVNIFYPIQTSGGLKFHGHIKIHRTVVKQNSHLFRQWFESDPKVPKPATPFEMLNTNDPAYTRMVANRVLDHSMVCFGVWAYTGMVFDRSDYYPQMWHFGKIIGAPAFMNAILHKLRDKILLEVDSGMGIDGTEVGLPLLQLCCLESDFLIWGQGSVLLPVDWKNRQLLKFLIDSYAHRVFHDQLANQDSVWQEINRGEDQLSLQIKRAVGITQYPDEAPWRDSCFSAYLVDEEMSTISQR